jgi:chromosome segregation ATPase
MRNIAIALLVAMLLTGIAAEAQQAAGAAAAINDGLARIDTIAKQIGQIDDVTLPQLKEKKARLDDVADLLHKAVNNVKAKDADLEQRTAVQDAAIAQHNANQCRGTAAQCAAYTAEAERLNAGSAALKRESDNLNTYKQGLKERFDQLSQDTLAWTAAGKKAMADRDDLAQRGKAILSSLGRFANEYGSCMDKYPQDDDEGLKHHCGNVQFDQVRKNLGKLRNIGTGGITPNN